METRDPEAEKMEQELRVLLQQNPELDEDGETKKMHMHADDEERQILVRR